MLLDALSVKGPPSFGKVHPLPKVFDADFLVPCPNEAAFDAVKPIIIAASTLVRQADQTCAELDPPHDGIDIKRAGMLAELDSARTTVFPAQVGEIDNPALCPAHESVQAGERICGLGDGFEEQRADLAQRLKDGLHELGGDLTCDLVGEGERDRFGALGVKVLAVRRDLRGIDHPTVRGMKRGYFFFENDEEISEMLEGAQGYWRAIWEADVNVEPALVAGGGPEIIAS